MGISIEDLEASLGRVEPRIHWLVSSFQIPGQAVESVLEKAVVAVLEEPEPAASTDPDALLLGSVQRECLIYWRDLRRRVLGQ